MLGIAIAAAVVKIIDRIENANQYTLNLQAEQLTQLLSAQNSISAGQLFNLDNNEALQQLVDGLSASPAVVDIVIYDADGNIVVNSAQSKTLVSRLKSQGSKTFANYLPRVATIESDGDRLGFVRMVLAYPELQQGTHHQRERNHDLLQLAVLLAGIAGFLLAWGCLRQRLRPRAETETTQPSTEQHDP